MIIAGGEPELCCRRQGKREGGIYACPMHYVCVSLVQGLCEVTGEKNWRTWNPRMHGNTDKEAQVWRGSLVSRSRLAVRCMGVSTFRFPIVGVLGLAAITSTLCTVHISVHGSVAAWARATYQYYVNGTDTTLVWGSLRLTPAGPKYIALNFWGSKFCE